MGICYKLHGDEEESNDQLIGKQLGRESPWDPANMKVIMSQQYVLIVKKANSNLLYVKKGFPSGKGRWPFFSAER